MSTIPLIRNPGPRLMTAVRKPESAYRRPHFNAVTSRSGDRELRRPNSTKITPNTTKWGCNRRNRLGWSLIERWNASESAKTGPKYVIIQIRRAAITELAGHVTRPGSSNLRKMKPKHDEKTPEWAANSLRKTGSNGEGASTLRKASKHPKPRLNRSTMVGQNSTETEGSLRRAEAGHMIRSGSSKFDGIKPKHDENCLEEC